MIQREIEKLVPDGTRFSVSASEQSDHGDYSSNVALVLARQTKRIPKEAADEIKKNIANRLLNIVERIAIAGPGFLNFYLRRDALCAAFERRISKEKPIFAKTTKGEKKRICLEFVSANPTGPLTMANGRGGFYGDVLANILEAAGHKVTREYYINDAGNQIRLLGESILAAEGKIPKREEYYQGSYIRELRGKTLKQAASYLLKKIKASLKRAGIRFDIWFSEEKNIHKTQALMKTLKFLKEKKLTKEYDGALWLGAQENGGAVLIKSDGAPTYFLGDLAYHYDKFIKRKFDIAINIWGADHHGYVARMETGIAALDIDPARLHIIIMQLVRLVSGGKEVRMSKRKGEFVTLDGLLDRVGADAARWFFLERSPDTHMDFDLDLARERSKKNPVYYVQYAHARACSILKKNNLKSTWESDSQVADFLKLLEKQEELMLIKKILQSQEIIEDIALDYRVQRLPKYVYELAQTFTNFYENCRVIDIVNQELTNARIHLVQAAQKTLAEALSLMGIEAPEKM